MLRQPDEKHRDIARRHARDPSGLPDGKRTNFIELLPRLDAKTCNGQIVDLFWKQAAFLSRKLRDLPLLTLDIARVLHLNLHGLAHCVRKRWALGVKRCKILIADLRPPQKIREPCRAP